MYDVSKLAEIDEEQNMPGLPEDMKEDKPEDSEKQTEEDKEDYPDDKESEDKTQECEVSIGGHCLK